MANNFDLSNLALKAVCPNNEILYDDKGLPSIMVKIPKMTYAQLGLGSSTATFPAFIVNGQEVDAIYISKYQNIVQNGRAYSLPCQDPKHTINFDSARAACEAKGAGWHLLTNMEWAAIALWCKANGTMPYGNNDYGKDSRESVYKAIPMAFDGNGKITRIATGSGPLSWSHDGTPSGIFDLNGNINEWVGGLRLVKGELQILANNNAADSDHSQAAASAEWKAISGADGTLITPAGDGTTAGSVKLDWASGHGRWATTLTTQTDDWRNCELESVDTDGNVGADAQLLLQALGLFKYDTTAGAYQGDRLYFRNKVAETVFFRGGDWVNAAVAGVFRAGGNYERSVTSDNLGFRSAYIQLPAGA